MDDLASNAVSLILLLFVLAVILANQNQLSDESGLIRLFGLAFVILGSAIWLAGFLSLGRHFTSSVEPKNLITCGIYSKLRHPMYTGGLVFYIGLSFFFASAFGLFLTAIILFPMFAYFANQEEKQLVKKYGSKYLAYKAKTAI